LLAALLLQLLHHQEVLPAVKADGQEHEQAGLC
jgi:hypothetical protein